MAKDNLTFELSGEVSLRVMADGFQQLNRLIGALAEEVSRRAEIRWIVDDLRPGSAVVTIRGESSDIDAVDRVVTAYGLVGASLARGEAIPFSERVQSCAREIMSVLDRQVTAIRFETPESEWTVLSPTAKPRLARPVAAYGAVEGRIETLTKRRGLRFILYDTLHDKAVACYLDQGQEEMMRGAWGRRAIIEGWVSRDPLTGLPSSIRQVSHIELLPDTARGSYRNARGVLPFDPTALPAEQRIRRLRDG